jgi:hypothetical protein
MLRRLQKGKLPGRVVERRLLRKARRLAALPAAVPLEPIAFEPFASDAEVDAWIAKVAWLDHTDDAPADLLEDAALLAPYAVERARLHGPEGAAYRAELQRQGALIAASPTDAEDQGFMDQLQAGAAEA